MGGHRSRLISTVGRFTRYLVLEDVVSKHFASLTAVWILSEGEEQRPLVTSRFSVPKEDPRQFPCRLVAKGAP